MPIEWSKSNADITALAGVWKDRPRTLEEIRKKAWKRNWFQSFEKFSYNE